MPDIKGVSMLSDAQRADIKLAKEKISLLEKVVALSDKTKPDIKRISQDITNTKERLDILEKV